LLNPKTCSKVRLGWVKGENNEKIETQREKYVEGCSQGSKIKRIEQYRLLKGCDSNFEVKCSKVVTKSRKKLLSKIPSVKLLIIVIIDFKCYPSIYCLMQSSSFICSKF